MACLIWLMHCDVLQECCPGPSVECRKVNRNELTFVFIILKCKQTFITLSKIARREQLHLHGSLKAGLKLSEKCD